MPVNNNESWTALKTLYFEQQATENEPKRIELAFLYENSIVINDCFKDGSVGGVDFFCRKKEEEEEGGEELVCQYSMNVGNCLSRQNK